jgi:CDP-glucose 4,6-dehydratase
VRDKYNLSSFYKGKRIFVTGHTGFKGSWLSAWLVSMGAVVKGFSIDIPTKPSHFEAIGLSSQMQDIRGDIRDFHAVKKEIQSFQPHHIFHLAAQPIVKTSYDYPLETFQTNVMGSVHVLEAAKQWNEEQSSIPLHSIIIVTSDKCYENQNQCMSYRETDPMGGYDPYSASKGCTEIVVSSYQKSFFGATSIGVASARAGNVIGGGDWGKERLIPDLMRAFSKGESLTLRSPSSIRPWQHVLDPLSGYLLLGKRLSEQPQTYSGGWNFGPREVDIATVEEVVRRCIQYWPNHTYQVAADKLYHEANLLQLDIHKAVTLLQWKPTWMLDKALKNTIEWYRQVTQHGLDAAKDLTCHQIEEFMNE